MAIALILWCIAARLPQRQDTEKYNTHRSPEQERLYLYTERKKQREREIEREYAYVSK